MAQEPLGPGSSPSRPRRGAEAGPEKVLVVLGCEKAEKAAPFQQTHTCFVLCWGRQCALSAMTPHSPASNQLCAWDNSSARALGPGNPNSHSHLSGRPFRAQLQALGMPGCSRVKYAIVSQSVFLSNLAFIKASLLKPQVSTI